MQPLPRTVDTVTLPEIALHSSTDGKKLRYPQNALMLHAPRLKVITWTDGRVTLDTGQTSITLTPNQLALLDHARAKGASP